MTTEIGPGSLDIVSIVKGHLEIKFDGNDPNALETARAAITDMLDRHYLIITTDAKGKEHKVSVISINLVALDFDSLRDFCG